MLASRFGLRLSSLGCNQALHNATRASSSAKPAFVRVPEAKLTKLDNGMRVASENFNTPTCTVGVYIDAGSRQESDATSGVANLVRQLAFKGTKNRSGSDIQQQAEARGVKLNAKVGREKTYFYANCFSKDVPWAVELLADVLQNPAFDQAAVDKQRPESIRKLEEVEGDMNQVVMDYLHAAAYQGTPMSRPVLGQVDTLQSMRAQDLQEYAACNFLPHRMVLAAAGAVDHSELAELGKRFFGSMTNDYSGEVPDPAAATRFTGSTLLDRDDHLPFAHVAIAIEGPGADSVDSVPMMVASAYIGSWSRSFGGGNNIASKLARQAHDSFNGGIKSYSSFFKRYNDTSLWGLKFVSNAESVNYFTKDFQTDWMMMSQDVRNFDLTRSKNALLTAIYEKMNGTESAFKELGRQVLFYGRRIPMEEMEERIARVKPSTINDIAQQYVYDRCPAVAAYGPIEGLPDYNRIRAKMWFYRV